MSSISDIVITKERKNFVKCCMLMVKYCRGVMYEIVERSIEPVFGDLTVEKLQEKYNNKTGNKENLPTLIVDLFNDLKDMTPVETDFDISSLYFLMKFFCDNIEPPKNGWGEVRKKETLSVGKCSEKMQSTVGEEENMSIGDYIEKIQSLRNDILTKFGKKAEIPDLEFRSLYREIESSIVWLEKQYGGKKFQGILGRINAKDKTTNERKESKMILKEFWKCCETAVDLEDDGICKRDLDKAVEFKKAAGEDPEETLRQQERALCQLKELVDRMNEHVNMANRKIDNLEKENKKLKDEMEKMRNEQRQK